MGPLEQQLPLPYDQQPDFMQPGVQSHGTTSHARAGSRSGFRARKARNIVQEQLMKMNRINRGLEKPNQDIGDSIAPATQQNAAASSVTRPVRHDGMGSAQTHYSQSDMAPAGSGSIVQAQR